MKRQGLFSLPYNPLVEITSLCIAAGMIETTTYEALINNNGSRSMFFESICFVLLHQPKHARERLRNLAMSYYYNDSSSGYYNTTNSTLPPDLQKLVRFWRIPPISDVSEYANSSTYWPSSAV